MQGQDPPDDVFVERQIESFGQVLRDPGTTETGIALFEFTDRLDQRFIWSFRARLALGMGGIQVSVFKIPQPTMEAEQGGRAENDSCADESARIKETGAEAEEQPVGEDEPRSSLALSPQDQELVLQE